ncbi:MAG TPA: efflux transporter outer membrane subunit [Steroidobacteraceae bacterium]
MTRAALRAPVACALAAALLAACAIGPDYERPGELVEVEEYRGVLTPQQAESYADLGWATIFNDPELLEVLREALANNLDLRIAVARVEEFRGRARVSRSGLGPQLRGTGSTSPSSLGDEDSTYSLGLSLSWEIDLFGKLRRANESARAQLLASEDNARGVMTTLVADAASTWFELRELDEEVQIINDTIKSQQESLALVEALNRSGVASGTEEQQAVGQLATTRAQLPVAEQRRQQTENRLRFLLGYPADRIPRIQSPRAFPVPEQIPVGLPSQLLARRPDLRALENQLHAATAQIGVAQASRFPYLSLGLTSFFGLVSPELGKLLDSDDPSEELFSIGPTLDAPIWQSGAGTGNVEVARAQARQAELAYRRGVLQALREVSDSLVASDKVREFIAQNTVRADASREVLRLQRMRYRGGVVSYLEVLDAERQFFSAEIDLARAKLDQLSAYVELYRALGGGWSEPEIERLLASPAK